jgi:predicted nuclease of restriction endonuclease-like (RecB) superfamily
MAKKQVVKYSGVDISATEQTFFSEISEILQAGRDMTYRAVNTAMVQTYWRVGKRIVEQEQQGKSRAHYGDYLIVNLSRYLTDLLGQGFSVANLKNMRQFYIAFSEFDEKATQCVANLSWSHYRLIMRLETQVERDWYIKEASEQNWGVRQLERNIRSGYYRRLLSSDRSDGYGINQAKAFVKDPYVLEFLDVPADLTGKEGVLEHALITHLQKFLLELGKGFSFVAEQMRISTETSHFYVDLVFYNYLLKCFVVIDLKTVKLTHQDIGQMDMYVRMFDELKRGEDDNPTLGIILCVDKDETIVKYSVLKESHQLFASKYQTVLPSEEELSAMLELQNRKLIEEQEEGDIYFES